MIVQYCTDNLIDTTNKATRNDSTKTHLKGQKKGLAIILSGENHQESPDN